MRGYPPSTSLLFLFLPGDSHRAHFLGKHPPLAGEVRAELTTKSQALATGTSWGDGL